MTISPRAFDRSRASSSSRIARRRVVEASRRPVPTDARDSTNGRRRRRRERARDDDDARETKMKRVRSIARTSEGVHDARVSCCVVAMRKRVFRTTRRTVQPSSVSVGDTSGMFAADGMVEIHVSP